jgi:predicted transcriptional regulator
MCKLKDALRLKFEGGQSHQQIANALAISKGVVTKYVGLAVTAQTRLAGHRRDGRSEP